MQRPVAWLFVSANTVLCSACAAILGSKQKTFDLQSTPQGADVFTEGNRLGTTPLRIKLSNTKAHTFVFRLEGYKEATCYLTRGTDGGWVILDVLMGLVPIVIDAATNSWSQTKGEDCTGALEPLAGGPAPIAVSTTSSPQVKAVDAPPASIPATPHQQAPVARRVTPATSTPRVAPPPAARQVIQDRTLGAPTASVAGVPEFTCEGRVSAPRDNPQEELRRLYVGDLRRAGIVECVEEVSGDLVRIMAGPQFKSLSAENRDSRLSRLWGLYGSPVNMLFELWDSSGRFAEYSSVGFRQVEGATSTGPR